MTVLMALLLILPFAASAGEELPDTAPASPEDSVAQRFSAPLLGQDELETLYLESPLLLQEPEKRKGGDSLSNDRRYPETDLLLRERQQSRRDEPPAPIEPQLVKPPPLYRPPEQL